jgi:hypothetical protein
LCCRTPGRVTFETYKLNAAAYFRDVGINVDRAPDVRIKSLGCYVVVRFDENAREKIAGYISGKGSERLCECVKQIKAKTDCDNGLI